MSHPIPRPPSEAIPRLIRLAGLSCLGFCTAFATPAAGVPALCRRASSLRGAPAVCPRLRGGGASALTMPAKGGGRRAGHKTGEDTVDIEDLTVPGGLSAEEAGVMAGKLVSWYSSVPPSQRHLPGL